MSRNDENSFFSFFFCHLLVCFCNLLCPILDKSWCIIPTLNRCQFNSVSFGLFLCSSIICFHTKCRVMWGKDDRYGFGDSIFSHLLNRIFNEWLNMFQTDIHAKFIIILHVIRLCFYSLCLLFFISYLRDHIAYCHISFCIIFCVFITHL